MTDRHQLERLMFTINDVRDAQRQLNEKKKTVKDPDQLKNMVQDVRFKWDALDNLIKALRQQGYVATKHAESNTEQSKMF